MASSDQEEMVTLEQLSAATEAAFLPGLGQALAQCHDQIRTNNLIAIGALGRIPCEVRLQIYDWLLPLSRHEQCNDILHHTQRPERAPSKCNGHHVYQQSDMP